MNNILIASSACLWLGLFVGVLVGYLWGHATGSRPWRAEQRRREIEAALLGRPNPRHRATAEPAVIRTARVISTKAWRK